MRWGGQVAFGSQAVLTLGVSPETEQGQAGPDPDIYGCNALLHSRSDFLTAFICLYPLALPEGAGGEDRLIYNPLSAGESAL